MKKVARYCLVLMIAMLLLPQLVFAHEVVADLESMSKGETALFYFKLGFQHILPWGADHILFVLSLFLFSTRLKDIIIQSTAFTIAHSVTLALCIYGVIKPPAAVVEPLISLSIVFVALENLFSFKIRKTRLGVIFLFGLLHGLGFASSLAELGFQSTELVSSVLSFNIGIEAGQVTVILLAYILIGKWFSGKPFYRRLIVQPLSVLIISIAAYWTFERIFLV